MSILNLTTKALCSLLYLKTQMQKTPHESKPFEQLHAGKEGDQGRSRWGETIQTPNGDVPQQRVRVRESLIIRHSWESSRGPEEFRCPRSDTSGTDSIFLGFGHTLSLTALIPIDKCRHCRRTKWK